MEVGGDEGPAGDAHGSPVARDRPGEPDPAAAGGADPGALARLDLDSSVLAFGERVRSEPEALDHISSDRPAPGPGVGG